MKFYTFIAGLPAHSIQGSFLQQYVSVAYILMYLPSLVANTWLSLNTNNSWANRTHPSYTLINEGQIL